MNLSQNKRIAYLRTGSDHLSLVRFIEEALKSLPIKCGVDVTQLLELGAIYIEGQRAQRDINLPRDTLVRVHLSPKRYSLPHVSPEQLVVHDGGDFVIAFKPMGLPAHAGLDNAREHLLELLRPLWGYELRACQRLDQWTEGLTVIAKTKTFQAYFQRLICSGRINKYYLARTRSPLPIGLHTHFMDIKSPIPRRASLEGGSGLKKLVLEVLEQKVLPDGTYSNRIRLGTGRTHQIRAQASALGSPLVGDPLYDLASFGLNESNPPPKHLSASLLSVEVSWVETIGLQKFVAPASLATYPL